MKYVSPGAYFREMDFSLYVPNLSTTICGMVGTATKGPENVPTLITSVPQFIATFGNPSPQHFMPYAALEYLRRGKILLVVRISGTTATASSATFNAVKTANVASSAVAPVTIDAASSTLRIIHTDERTTPYVVTDSTITIAAATYASHAALVTEISNKLKRSAAFTEKVTAVLDNSKLTLAAIEASTQVKIQVQEAATNSAHTILGLATTEAAGTDAGTFVLEAASVGTHGNFVSVQMVPKADFTFDIVVFEGTPLNTAGYRTELQQGFTLNDTNTAKWLGNIGTVVTTQVNGEDVRTVTAGTSTALVLGEETLANGLTLTVPERKVTALTGGDDGLASVINADYIGISSPIKTGLQIFADPDSIDVNILCVPGISAPSVINEMLAICEERGDAIAIVDPPDNYSPQQIVDWHNGAGAFVDHQAFNTSYGALYWPWVKVYDSYNGVDVFTPPCGHVAAVYAYTDFIAETWFAPAGFNRAHLVAATSVRYNANHGEREYMYGNQNCVNPIVQFPKEGITIWGQKTLQRAPTARDRVNVRRLLLYLRKVIATAVKYLIFEPDDAATWRQFVRLVRPFMEAVKNRRGVYTYEIICDETTNPPSSIDNNEMGARIYLQPTKAAERINVDFVLTPTGAKFSDYAELVY